MVDERQCMNLLNQRRIRWPVIGHRGRSQIQDFVVIDETRPLLHKLNEG